MTLTLTGVAGGLVIAVADDVGLSSSQNEQDSRFWGALPTPILEPADSQEAYEYAKRPSNSRAFPDGGDPAHDDAHLPRQGAGHRRRTRAARGSRVQGSARWVMVPGAAAASR